MTWRVSVLPYLPGARLVQPVPACIPFAGISCASFAGLTVGHAPKGVITTQPSDLR